MSNTPLVQNIPSSPQPPALKLGFSIPCAWIIYIAEISIGAVYLHDCPRQPYIPIYLIVKGVFNLILQFLPCTREQEDGSRSPLNYACTSLISLFLFCWFITGNVWIYSIYQPNYNKNTTDINTYCDKTLYLFAFWITNLNYILIGVLFVCVCCCSFASPSSSTSRSQGNRINV